MYLNDALDVAVPHKEEKPPPLDPKLQAWYEESYPYGKGHTVGRPQRLGGDVCHYLNGRHACYQVRDFCPRDEARAYTREALQISFNRRVG